MIFFRFPCFQKKTLFINKIDPIIYFSDYYRIKDESTQLIFKLISKPNFNPPLPEIISFLLRKVSHSRCFNLNFAGILI